MAQINIFTSDISN